MKRFLPFLTLLLISLLFTLPFLKPGFFPTHDGEWAIIRLAEMEREIKDLQIPPRWADYLNHGFGYPLFLFTYPLPFYTGLFFRFLQFSLIDSIKIIFVASVIFSAISMFLLGKELGGKYAGFVSAVFYVVAPFRLINLYVRGSIGEALSFVFAPLLFFLSIKYIKKPTRLLLTFCSLVLALLILSHNVMALVFFFLWIGFFYTVLFSLKKDLWLYTWKGLIHIMLLGFGLSAYFFGPALLEKKYILLSQMNLADLKSNFINPRDFLFSPWRYGNLPSFQLGLAQILASIFGLIAVLKQKSSRKKFLALACYILFAIILLIFLTHPSSLIFWKMPPLSWFDFPWRLISPLGFILAISTIFLSINRLGKIVGGFLALLAIFLNLQLAKPLNYFNRTNAYYATNDATTTSAQELMPLWVKEQPTKRYQNKVEIEEGQGEINELTYNSKQIKFQLAAYTKNKILVNTVYFPGWQFFDNGKQISLTYKDRPDGLIRFDLSEGNHNLTGKFKSTAVRTWTNTVSIISFIIILGILLGQAVSALRKK